MAVSSVLIVSMMGLTVIFGYPAEQPITFSPDSTSISTTTMNPRHVPSSVCKSMNPAHGNSLPQNVSAPYEITVSSKEVAPGATVRVTLAGIADETFKGAYVQGRVDGVPVGRFVKLSDDPLIVVADCPPLTQNAASYISNKYAVNQVELDWVAPSYAAMKEVTFRATFVKTYREFWVGVESRGVKITGNGQTY